MHLPLPLKLFRQDFSRILLLVNILRLLCLYFWCRTCYVNREGKKSLHSIQKILILIFFAERIIIKKVKGEVLWLEGFFCNTVEKVRHSLMQKDCTDSDWISILKPCHRVSMKAVSSWNRLSEYPALHMHDSMAAMCEFSFSTQQLFNFNRFRLTLRKFFLNMHSKIKTYRNWIHNRNFKN